MKCSECGETTQIIETRSTAYGVRRRHKCYVCGSLFTTVEMTMDKYKALRKIQNAYDRVVKKIFKANDRFEDLVQEVAGDSGG